MKYDIHNINNNMMEDTSALSNFHLITICYLMKIKQTRRNVFYCKLLMQIIVQFY